MGRRRRKYKKLQLLKPPRRLPTVFDCPHCGVRMMTVDLNKKERNEEGLVKALIRCGKCGLQAVMWVPEIYQPVDVYSKFLDAFLEGKIEYTFVRSGKEAKVELSELLASEEGEEVEVGETGESGEVPEEQTG